MPNISWSIELEMTKFFKISANNIVIKKFGAFFTFFKVKTKYSYTIWVDHFESLKKLTKLIVQLVQVKF